MLSASYIEARKALVDRDLRKLEDDVADIASSIGTLRNELDSVKTEDDAEKFDKRVDEMFEKLKILQLQ
nr:MAG TPA: Flagella accessory protein C (FlaC) [Bacteriophage sp.]